MNLRRTLLLALVLMAMATGCAESPLTDIIVGQPRMGKTRSLGHAEYAVAFAQGRQVMQQYFQLDRADPDKGVITTKPKPIGERPARLLGKSSARKRATMTLLREGPEIVAYVSVPIEQRSTTETFPKMPQNEPYSSVPNQSPAYEEAATTPQQNELWRINSYDHRLEESILDDLYKRMHPDPKQ
jgi:hypothetical protein